MTVKELIEKLKEFPEDLPVSVQTDSFFGGYSVIDDVKKETVCEMGNLMSEYESIIFWT